jgi:arsenite methyltransferase
MGNLSSVKEYWDASPMSVLHNSLYPVLLLNVKLETPMQPSFTEIYRVLKPRGRILISDLVTAGDLPEDMRASAAAWADCLGGAMEKEAYLATIRRAGFAEVAAVSESSYEAPGMDERLRGKILSGKVHASK